MLRFVATHTPLVSPAKVQLLCPSPCEGKTAGAEAWASQVSDAVTGLGLGTLSGMEEQLKENGRKSKLSRER